MLKEGIRALKKAEVIELVMPAQSAVAEQSSESAGKKVNIKGCLNRFFFFWGRCTSEDCNDCLVFSGCHDVSWVL